MCWLSLCRTWLVGKLESLKQKCFSVYLPVVGNKWHRTDWFFSPHSMLSGHLNTAPKWIWYTSKFASLWAKQRRDGEGIGGGGVQRTIKRDETIILTGTVCCSGSSALPLAFHCHRKLKIDSIY